MPYEVIRSHEICAGHRVVGHESKCRHLHGHNYVFHFHVAPKMKCIPRAEYEKPHPTLDQVGRVIDFSVVKTTLCQWLEDNWDHKFLHWEKDPLINGLKGLLNDLADNWDDISTYVGAEEHAHFFNSMVSLPFNPTAENLAACMVDVIGPQLLDPYGVELIECKIEETSKCHVEYRK